MQKLCWTETLGIKIFTNKHHSILLLFPQLKPSSYSLSYRFKLNAMLVRDYDLNL